jgi:hypothetical protein
MPAVGVWRKESIAAGDRLCTRPVRGTVVWTLLQMVKGAGLTRTTRFIEMTLF